MFTREFCTFTREFALFTREFVLFNREFVLFSRGSASLLVSSCCFLVVLQVYS
ncbi:hypothetical protein [Peribacillus sp. ACCC06369]|uniref:hypothetical protein n=1 Tax=Peribacillus sp. ACCC06369 TaxID=3055860 RepID=UPI0025A06938|nr:hypothetical protein [Peribacillus sp. ACCC06369]MDM5360949.1 hypothetical protein [Peribacillus sp. ACCC06369]